MKVEEYQRALDALVGKACWGIAVGQNTGSVVNLHFGAAIPRPLRLPNKTLPEVIRKNEGEFGLLVECAWRLGIADRIVCSWNGAFSTPSQFADVIGKLEGARVVGVRLLAPILDLEIHFTDRRQLSIFCDQVTPDDDNYSYFTTKRTYIVASGGELITEERVPLGPLPSTP